jgi:hypothetical protein
MSLRNLGFYKELPYGDPSGSSIAEQVRLDPATKERVLHYLESAPVLAASQEVFADFFTGEAVGSWNVHTDGEWLWYSDLPHYVRTHDSVLDAEFLRDIADRTEAHLSQDELTRISVELRNGA